MSNIETAAQAKPMAVAAVGATEEEEEERAMFKVAISVTTVSTCGILGSPTVGGGGGGSARRSTSCYKFFAMFYVVAMLAAFTLGFLLLVLSVRVGRPRRRAAAAVARKKLIMWVSLGMVYVAVVTGTIVALVESF